MERMFEIETVSPWRRIERRSPDGGIVDYVEVGACSQCGRGVDRDTPTEYRLIGVKLHCAPCAEADGAADRAADYVGERNTPTT